MSVFRFILCIIFPPLAVLGMGFGNFWLVCVLTLVGWVPGVIGALIINTIHATEQRPKPDSLRLQKTV